jgi:hypothetical protein
VGRDVAEGDEATEAAGRDHRDARILPEGRDEDRPSHHLLKPGRPPPRMRLATGEQSGDHDDGVVRKRFRVVGDQGLPGTAADKSRASTC